MSEEIDEESWEYLQESGQINMKTFKRYGGISGSTKQIENMKKTTKKDNQEAKKKLEKILSIIDSCHEEKKSIKDKNYINIVKDREEKLNNCKKYLKTQFFGIDCEIDKIIKTIESWYIMPEIIERPVIVNLWGLTGVGKTDLIRKMVSYLKYDDKFLEVQMNSKGEVETFSNTDDLYDGYSDKHTSLHDMIVTESNINPGDAGIILIDEFQRYKTVSNGQDISHEGMHDLWNLLSDGKFGSKTSNKAIVLEMIQSIYKNSKHNAANEDYINKTGITMDYMYATNWKSELNLSDPVSKIMTYTEEEKLNVLEKYLIEDIVSDVKDYSKCLIFISGNLDSLFSGSRDTSNVDIDADIFYGLTKDITIIDVKKCLSEMYRPEQVARLGNNHIIYPSLNKQAYEQIISNSLNRIVDKIKNDLNISMKLDSSVNDFIYRNGVYPSQGTRPLFSTLYSLFENKMTDVFSEAIKGKHKNIEISYADEKYNVKLDKKKLSIECVGDIDAIKKKQDSNAIYSVAVHEAGHALTYCLLTGHSPLQVTVSTSIEEENGGYVLYDTLDTKDGMKNQMAIGWAGQIAEELVFGENNVSSGCSQDIKDITSIAVRMTRELGMSSVNKSFTFTQGTGSTNLGEANYDESLKDEIKDLVDDAYDVSYNLLIENKTIFIDIVDKLVVNKILGKKDIINIFKKHNIDISGEKKRVDVKALFENFKKGK